MSVDGSTPRPRPQQPPATAPEPQPAPRRGPGRPAALCAAPWPGPGTARPWTRGKPPSCWRRAATSSPSCSGMPRGPGTPGWSARAAPAIITYSRKVFIPLTRLCRDRCGYCTFATVPGRLGRALPVAGRGHRDRRPGRRARLQGGAVHARRPARGPVAPGQGVAGRARLRRHPVLRQGHGDPGAGGDRPAAAPQPRGAELAGLPAAEAGGAVDGDDAGDDRAAAVHRAGRPAFRQPGQGPGGPAAGPRGRRPQQRPVHHRHPDRHRRDRGGTG